MYTISTAIVKHAYAWVCAQTYAGSFPRALKTVQNVQFITLTCIFATNYFYFDCNYSYFPFGAEANLTVLPLYLMHVFDGLLVFT